MQGCGDSVRVGGGIVTIFYYCIPTRVMLQCKSNDTSKQRPVSKAPAGTPARGIAHKNNGGSSFLKQIFYNVHLFNAFSVFCFS